MGYFNILWLFGNIGKEERLLNSFCETSLPLILKPDRQDKVKLQANLTYEYWWKILNKTLANRLQQHTKLVWRWQSELPPPCTQSIEMIVKLFWKQTNSCTQTYNEGALRLLEQREKANGEKCCFTRVTWTCSFLEHHSNDSEVIFLKA